VTSLGRSDVFVAGAGELYEGPCWDPRTGTLVWVDILAGAVHVADPVTGQRQVHTLGMPVSAVAPRRSGGWVAAVERGFLLLDESWHPVGGVVPAPGQPDGTRFNDGKCDPAGRFWAGTLAYDGTPGAGALYVLDPAGTVREVLRGVTNSNGLAWSPDGGTLYYVDTGRGTIDCMDVDPSSGAVANRRALVTVPGAEGLPDGLTIDREGYLWLALWGGSCVRRYSPSGVLDRVVGLPVERVTSMAFGGAALDELFITTAWEGLTLIEREHQPLAGSVFRHRPGVTGLPPAAFAG
jgi:sugar lactone lactonase YvrE